MPRKKKNPKAKRAGTAMADRLEFVRKTNGLPTIKAFRDKLIELGGDERVPSYQAIQNYHRHRESPVSYLVLVHEMFGANLAWLANGPGDLATRSPDVEEVSDLVQELRFERGLWGIRQAPFLGPLCRGTGGFYLGVHPITFVDSLRGLAGKSVTYTYDGSPDEDIRHAAAESLEEDKMLDALLARTWEGAINFLSHVFGREALDTITVAQQSHFTGQFMMAIRSIVPDYGEPAVTVEVNDA